MTLPMSAEQRSRFEAWFQRKSYRFAHFGAATRCAFGPGVHGASRAIVNHAGLLGPSGYGSLGFGETSEMPCAASRSLASDAASGLLRK
jgi:hypothetical protein